MQFTIPEYIYSHWLFEDPVKFQWWLKLLSLVAGEDCVMTVRGVERKCGYGQLVTTQGELAKHWKTSTEKAQAFLRKLETNGEISRKTDAKLTQITICNIEDYDIFGRNLDAKLTHRRKVDAILTRLNTVLSTLSDDDRRNLDAKLTQSQKSKRKEPKENIYIHITSANADVQEDKSSCSVSHAREEISGLEKGERSKKVKATSPKKTTPTIITKAREIFEGHYQVLYQEPYYWTAKDGRHMKQLLQKISFSRSHRENPLPIDDDSVLQALQKFLESINKEWVMDNFSVANINSQYNNIVSEIRNRSKLSNNVRYNQTQGTTMRADVADLARQAAAIDNSIAEADRRYLERLNQPVSDVTYEELPAVPSE